MIRKSKAHANRDRSDERPLQTTAQVVINRLRDENRALEEVDGTHLQDLYKNLIRLPEYVPQFLPDVIAPNSGTPVTFAIDYFDNAQKTLGVIVETRPIKELEFVVTNVAEQLQIPILLFHGASAETFVMSGKISQLVRGGQVALVKLETDHLSANAYNGLFLSPIFWEHCPESFEKVLVFQTDSLVCRNSDFELGDFLKFDYIGPKWPRRRPIGLVADGGIGGFSLRNLRLTKRALDKFPGSQWAGGEDGYFAFHIELMGGRIARGLECSKFCTQYAFRFRSFGAHKLGCLSAKDAHRFVEYCPESKHIRW